ncbi:glycosyltransferase family 2 protein [Dongia rigui]|uniref:Glycosyltransferase family 2 protein n=1 Tax=Dongia rigui TaxID=940149 RepID=A0ABU5DYI9_9PROT|nr:glycosyltransferase family 2 protein [Dongia rigui]MDY0872340.1 glycosyltransferase family 2 protein [Dongia rigui]
MSTPVVSIIIAAYRAQGFIADAVQSACAQALREIEIVVAPDEPADYGFLQQIDPRVRVLKGVPKPTGPGPARNRALEHARGRFIALLDADDLFAPDYLSLLVPLADAGGVAFGRTRITDWSGRVVREVGARGGEIGFADFATAFASLHAVVPRDVQRRWQDVLAEDVLFDLESLSLGGGRAPFAGAAVYQLRQRPQSVTRGAMFLDGIGPGYDRLIALVAAGETSIALAHRPSVIEVWRSWQAMNARFVAATAAGDRRDYQRFAADAAAV